MRFHHVLCCFIISVTVCFVLFWTYRENLSGSVIRNDVKIKLTLILSNIFFLDCIQYDYMCIMCTNAQLVFFNGY